MFSSLKQFLTRYRARRELRRKGVINSKPWFDLEQFGNALDRSSAPAVVMLVMVWAVSSVLLSMAAQKQLKDPGDWVVGQKATRTIHASRDFQYNDLEELAAKRREAAEEQPEFFRINTERSKQILNRIQELLQAAEQRLRMERDGGKFTPEADNLPARLAAEASPELLDQLEKINALERESGDFKRTLATMLAQGVIGASDKSGRNVGRKIRTVDQNNRISLVERTVLELPDPDAAGRRLARSVSHSTNEDLPPVRRQLAALFTQLIGPEGNLDFDAARTEAGRSAAQAAITESLRAKSRGDLLVTKGDRVTPQMLQMFQDYSRAEDDAANIDAELPVLFQNMVWSLVLVIFAAFYLHHLHPDVVRVNKRITLVALVVILSLLINYYSLGLFSYLVSENNFINNSLAVIAVPAALVAVLLSVIFGYRVALCAGFFVASITAMMVTPERTFDLALKGMVISSLAALAVRSSTNYRSYFFRIVVSVFPLTFVLNLNLLFWERSIPHLQEVLVALSLAFTNAFVTGILALLLIFLFEIVFNVSTNMALMVLCDYNHPLLERLKREAPGTFFHSLMVATLVEDAAREIGANPPKAKAGALFHDIGKLSMPQYFTENNLDSANQHLNLNPQMSSIIIRDHVKEGLALARQYRMCRTVRDAISQHHGNDLVHYFYAKALADKRRESSTAPVLESQFRYGGQPPRDKEMAIISLADACEAACRSLDKPSAAKIEQVVDDIFLKRYQDGQLNRADITLAELDKVRQSFINTLISMKHGRIAYQREPAQGEPAANEASEQLVGDQTVPPAETK